MVVSWFSAGLEGLLIEMRALGKEKRFTRPLSIPVQGECIVNTSKSWGELLDLLLHVKVVRVEAGFEVLGNE